ncbi:HNH endonuclease signature motif containing protein [Nocardioides sp.]|uniref:HNH endonuclease signature motif containing protein n=1 Tax=Nocardioides sp. TaxID=35761 RepID=UPI00351702AF
MEMATSDDIVGAVRAGRAALATACSGEMWTLGTAETATALREVSAARSALAALEADLLHHAETVGVHHESGAHSAADWFAITTRTTRRTARAAATTAAELATVPAVRRALVAAEIVPEQAAAIAHAVAPLDAGIREEAVAFLLEQARSHDATALRVLGSRIEAVADPEAADAAESAALEREEQRAAVRTRLSMADLGDGTVQGSFRIPTLHAAMLRKALLALAAPKHRRAVDGAGSYDHTVPTPAKWGRAFTELLERLDGADLARRGGTGATVVVTMTLESLRAQLEQAGLLDTGDRISAGEARRLAARAGLIPAVLGGGSQVLDWGRKRRFHTETQRLAIATMHRTCVTADCDADASQCEIDHDPAWEDGGGTDLTGVPRCPRHHRLHHLEQQRRRHSRGPRQAPSPAPPDPPPRC